MEFRPARSFLLISIIESAIIGMINKIRKGVNMKLKIRALLMILIASVISVNSQTKLDYPATKKVDVQDNYFGTIVKDPYRWLEDDTSAAVKEWVKEENKVTFGYLDKIPFREKIKQRLEKLWNYPKYSTPFKGGENYFFFKNDGLQNQDVLYIRKGLNAEPEVFLDPNKLSKDGTVSLTALAVSNDGKYLAYGTASGGSDWNEFRVMEVDNKILLPDDLKWIKFSGISWYKDGFFYSRYPTPPAGQELVTKNEFHKIYFHKVGTSQDADSLIFEDKNEPKMTMYAQTTEDERFLIVYTSKGTSNNALYVKDLNNPDSKFVTIVGNFENNYNVVDDLEGKLLVLTDKEAPKYRLIAVDPSDPAESNWKTIFPEKSDVLQSVSFVGGKLIAEYMKDASSRVFAYAPDGSDEKEIKLPGIGTVGSFSGKKGDKTAFYAFTSFTFPSTVYRFNTETLESEVYSQPKLDFKLDGYVTKQVFYKSKDGTKVPMFIVHKKGLKLDGNNPTYLYAYGGFNISLNPYFSVSRLIMLENGGIVAIPNLRG